MKMNHSDNEDRFTKHNSTLSESTTSNFSQEQSEQGFQDEQVLHSVPGVRNGGAPSAVAAARIKYADIVLKKIKTAHEHHLNKLDLSRLGISEIPEELLDLDHLQYLYLEGNTLECLPESFFDRLPNLKWLDLRRNYLCTLPHFYIGQHGNLQTLLLEGNELKSLPLELGLVGTLRGLNICDNPLEFPPSQVIANGTRAVLKFMRDLLHAKCSGTFDISAGSSDPLHAKEHLEDNFSNTGYGEQEKSKRKLRRGSLASQDSISSGEFASYYDEMNSDLGDLVLHSAAANKSPREKPKKSKKSSQIMVKASSADKASIMLRRKTKSSQINKFPEPPPADRVEQKFLEERKLTKLRHIKMQQDDVLQKRKEVEFLKAWRTDAKHLQAERYREAFIYGGAKDPVDVADLAPFGVDKRFMRVLTNEERIKMAVQKKHEEMRRPVSPETRLRIEQERQAKDQELEKKLRTHIKKMIERRKQPKDNPMEELKATKLDLEIAEKLQQEISQRRKNLEYRFTAFTG